MKEKIQSLFWGIISAGAALFIELIFFAIISSADTTNAETSLLVMLALSVLVEEIVKYITILRQIEPISFGRSAIINAWIAGIGFSLVEVAIFYQKSQLENLVFDWKDLIKISLLHISTFGIFGYKISMKEDNRIDIGLILSLAIIHFAYNISTHYQETIGYPIDIFILSLLLLYNLYDIVIVNKKLAR